MFPNNPSPQQPQFTFTSQLTQALKHLNQDSSIEPFTSHTPTSTTIDIEGNLKTIGSDLVRLYESRDFLIFAMVAWNGKLSSLLTIYYFGKLKGENQSKCVNGIKGKIVAMEWGYPEEVRDGDGDVHYQVKLIMGNDKGFIKILNPHNKPSLQTFQIDTKPIVSLQIPPPSSFHGHHLIFAMISDYNIYILTLKGHILAHFRPTIMMCDVGLSLSLHGSMKWMLEATEGGYLVLWRINENLYQKLGEIDKVTDGNRQVVNRVYNIFPTSILHAATVDGIRWAGFLGDLIAVVTLKGIFKIIALNIDQKQQFAILLSYQITKGQTIKDVKLLPKEQCLIVVKQEGYNNAFIECIFYSADLQVTSLLRIRVNQMLNIDGLILSKNMRYLFLRNGDKFFINYTKIFEERIAQHKRNNERIRQLNY